MKDCGLMHSSFIHFHESFLRSMTELKEFDAYPTLLNLQKSVTPFWEIAVEFKRKRLREFQDLMEAQAKAQSPMLIDGGGSRMIEDGGHRPPQRFWQVHAQDRQEFDDKVTRNKELAVLQKRSKMMRMNKRNTSR